jgi:hypothetical protein
MKARFVYETLDFERGGDPKRSLNIGKYRNYRKKISINTKEELIEALVPLLPLILDTDEIPEDIINGHGTKINQKYFNKILEYVNNYFIDYTVFVPCLFDKLKNMGFPDDNNSHDV